MLHTSTHASAQSFGWYWNNTAIFNHGEWRRLIRRWNDEFLKQADMKNIM